MKMPDQVAEFLSGKRFAVAGVSRQPGQAANAVFHKLRDSGYQVYAINRSHRDGERTVPSGSRVHSWANRRA